MRIICRFNSHWASPSVDPGGLCPRPTLVLCNINMYHVCISRWCTFRSFLMCLSVSSALFFSCFLVLFCFIWVFFILSYMMVSSINSRLVTFYRSPNAHAFILDIQDSLSLLNLSHLNGWFCIKRTLIEKQRLLWWIHLCFGSTARANYLIMHSVSMDGYFFVNDKMLFPFAVF